MRPRLFKAFIMACVLAGAAITIQTKWSPDCIGIDQWDPRYIWFHCWDPPACPECERA